MSIDNGLRNRLGGDDESPQVGMPSRPWVLPLGLLAAVLLGALVFWQLSANRTRVESARMTDPPPDAQPITGMETLPPPPDITTLTEAAQSAAALPPGALLPSEAAAPTPGPLAQTDPESRFRSPSLIVDLSEAQAQTTDAATNGGNGPSLTAGGVASALGGGAAGAGRLSSDEQFAQRLGVGDADTPARARRMSNQGYTVVQGAVIPAVLETAVNSDLPGYVRAIVSRDVRSFDGANVLVPRGSRLVGQYRSGVALGQSRAFVIWTRLIRPDGVGVSLAAPGTDALGRGGLEGRVDRHFLQRFGGAILLSLITAGGQVAANDSSDTQIIIASTQGAAGEAASVALQKDLDIAPTVKVPQGAPIRIFVTRDLDFSVLAE
jgi:type IV secretion system protein VirB10